MSNEDTPHEVAPEQITRVRAGHGANCSSIGSVIDTLFATAVIGTALFAAVAAALATEPVRVVTPNETTPRADEPSEAQP